jgi:hypothetical protein
VAATWGLQGLFEHKLAPVQIAEDQAVLCAIASLLPNSWVRRGRSGEAKDGDTASQLAGVHLVEVLAEQGVVGRRRAAVGADQHRGLERPGNARVLLDALDEVIKVSGGIGVKRNPAGERGNDGVRLTRLALQCCQVG